MSGFLGSGDDLTGAQGLLPRQGALHAMDWDLDSDNRLRQVLGGGLETVLPPGVLRGGAVVATSGLGVKLAASVGAPTDFWTPGGVWRQDADVNFNGCADNATNTVWWVLARTPRDQGTQGTPDTYALTLYATQDDTPPAGQPQPAAAWRRLASVVTLAGAVTTITDPPGKWAAVSVLPTVPKVIPFGASVLLPAGQQVIVRSLQFDGTLQIDGDLIFL